PRHTTSLLSPYTTLFRSHAGRVANDDLPAGSGGDINVVVTHGKVGYDLERGQGVHQGGVHRYGGIAQQAFYLAGLLGTDTVGWRSEEHTSELQSRFDLVC